MDEMSITGRVRIELFDEHGALKDVREFDNLVVSAGKIWIASRMANATQAVMGWMQLGTGTTAPGTNDTLLTTPVGSTVAATGTPNTNQVAYVATFAAGSPGSTWPTTFTEAGIFNNATPANGSMLGHTVFNGITKASGETMTVTWTITIN